MIGGAGVGVIGSDLMTGATAGSNDGTGNDAVGDAVCCTSETEDCNCNLKGGELTSPAKQLIFIGHPTPKSKINR